MTRLQDIAAHLRAAAVRIELGDEAGALARLQRAKRMIKRRSKRRDELDLKQALRDSIENE